MFNISKKIGWETFWDSVKFTWDSTFVDGLGPWDAIEIKPKSNTVLLHVLLIVFIMLIWYIHVHYCTLQNSVTFQEFKQYGHVKYFQK